MRGDKVRRRQSTETLCCFTPPHPLRVCAANVVCLLSGLTSLGGMFTRFLFFRVSFCVCLSDFSPSMCLCLLHLPFSICPSVYVSVSLVLPLKTPDLTLRVFFFFLLGIFFLFFWLITLGIFPAFEHPFLGSALFLDISRHHAGESHANYPSYWLRL